MVAASASGLEIAPNEPRREAPTACAIHLHHRTSQENVWQFLRINWLSNRVFASYDALVDQCCDAWNRLVEQPWTIMSLGLRPWAHRS